MRSSVSSDSVGAGVADLTNGGGWEEEGRSDEGWRVGPARWLLEWGTSSHIIHTHTHDTEYKSRKRDPGKAFSLRGLPDYMMAI